MDVVATETITTHWFEQNIPQICALYQANQTQTDSDTAYVAVGAYDVGSGATKYMGAIVDVQNLLLVDIFCEGAIPVLYRQDLIESPNNEFSDLIMDMGLNALELAKSNIQQEYTHGNYQFNCQLEHYGVATAAFREANNGEAFSHYLSEKLDFPIHIISQKDEGILAYYSAMSQATDSTHVAPVVWDIGGGSMQLTFQDLASEFHVMGSDVASQTFQSMVLTELLQKEVTDTPHPLSQSQVDAAIALAKNQFEVNSLDPALIQSNIEKGSPVFAVGSVHNFVIQPLCNLMNNKVDNQYTKDDLYHTITQLTDKTDQEILALMNNSNEQFIKNQLTSLILVYAVMDLMGIESVQTVKTSNVQGVALQHVQQKQNVKDIIEPFITLSDDKILAFNTVH